ncbi:uncharacterized protein LOC118697931 [Molothrus ater]|uniref:uncharacterized protein LOC118697931 n=1 Tax=Molothrus ater TaxID=84834 RepID=UPI0023E8B9F7|nr:uncharacterized protein LOC118697931 [Molothrus ater]
MSPGCPCPVPGHRDVPGMSPPCAGAPGCPRDVPALCRGTGMSPGCPCPVPGHRDVPGMSLPYVGAPGCPCPVSGHRDVPGMSLPCVGAPGCPRDVPALCRGTGMSPGGSPVPSPCPRALTPVATPAVLRQPPGAVACPCPRLPPRCPSRERGRARWATSREKISREKQNKKNPGMAGSVSPDTSRPLPCATAVPPRPPGVPAQLRSCPSAASPQCHQRPKPGLSRRQSAPVSPDLPCQPRCVTKCHPRPPNPPCQPRPAPSHRDPKSIPPLPTKSIPPVPQKSPHLCPQIHPTCSQIHPTCAPQIHPHPPHPAGATLALCPRCVRHSRDIPGTGTGRQPPPQIPSQIPSQI